MQFHLNGFKTGDPAILNAADMAPRDSSAALPTEVDVLVVGCGPAGLTLAAQLAAFPDVRTLIVEQKSGPLALGQADGIACRTMEMFEAFGFSERVLNEAYTVNETTFWKPDPDHRNAIMRGGRIQDTEESLSEFPHVILNQARVHDFYLDVMRRSRAGLMPAYSRRLTRLDIDAAASEDGPLTPVTASFERSDAGHEGEVETVRARYVVGCDGARSMVRTLLDRTLVGDSANHAWGVMDVLAVSDFPDIRLKAVVHSATEGNILIIPREGGYLVRLYIELDKLNENERAASRNITADQLTAAAQRILHPYTLDVKEVAWWSVYDIGQRLCDRFDDVPDADAGKRLPRAFIAGDACHTHSPKAGQGMNVSMQDAFNLGWKLASVVRGQCSPEILSTYTAERQAVAAELIDFDRRFAKMFSARPTTAGEASGQGVDPAEFQRYFVQQGRFTAGIATEYRGSPLTADKNDQQLAEGFAVGTRFHSSLVTRLADAQIMHLGHAVKADGRWRLFLFSDDQPANEASSRLAGICARLFDAPDSPIRRYTARAADIDSVFDVRAVLQQHHHDVAVEESPALLLPHKGRYGLKDYEKIFCAPVAGHDDIFDARGIDRGLGCIVIVRPDQHIAGVVPLDGFDALSRFFDAFMIPQQPDKA